MEFDSQIVSKVSVDLGLQAFHPNVCFQFLLNKEYVYYENGSHFEIQDGCPHTSKHTSLLLHFQT